MIYPSSGMRVSTGNLLVKRFWAKVRKTSKCWEWTGAMKRKHDPLHRYGKMYIRQKDCLAHRISWQLNRGPIPKGMSVLHKCDNPPCVRPSHLWIGTMAQNCTDRAKKGRNNHVCGENHTWSKLKESDILKIRKLYSSGLFTHEAIAAKYSVHRRTIGNIVNRLIWKHIP